MNSVKLSREDVLAVLLAYKERMCVLMNRTPTGSNIDACSAAIQTAEELEEMFNEAFSK